MNNPHPSLPRFFSALPRLSRTRLAVLLIATLIVAGLTLRYVRNARTPVSCANCNVILLSVDSLRPDHMSLYGYFRQTTPNIDRWAKDAFIFTNYFPTSYLTPISEMSVQTGRYPFANGVINFQSYLKDDTGTLAETLREIGYRTAAFGSSPEFKIFEALEASFRHGFDVYSIYEPDEYGAPPTRNSFPVARAIEWAKQDTRPFFMWLALGSAHWPYGHGEPKHFGNLAYRGLFRNLASGFKTYSQVYKGKFYPLPKDRMPQLFGVSPTALPYVLPYLSYEELLLQNAPKEITPVRQEDLDYVVARYDDGVLETNRIVGQILDALHAAGLEENTVIIFESEHGEDLGEHGYIGHYDIKDTTVRAPLIIKIPTIAGGRIKALISGVDIYSTLLDTLGLRHAARDGVSFWNYLTGQATAPRTEVYITRTPLWEWVYQLNKPSSLFERFRTEDNELHYHDTAIRTEDWKLVHHRARQAEETYSWWRYLTGEPVIVPEYELFNVKGDPLEQWNLYANYPTVARELMAKLQSWEKQLEEDIADIKLLPHEIQEYF